MYNMTKDPAPQGGDEVAASSGVMARDPHVTLVEGSSFCVSSHGGSIEAGGTHGLFVRDTRVLSRWELFVDGRPVESLAVVPAEPFSCRFLRSRRTSPTCSRSRTSAAALAVPSGGGSSDPTCSSGWSTPPTSAGSGSPPPEVT
jgi:hypothetical protein